MNKYIMNQLSQIESYCFSITENSVYICKNMYISYLKENTKNRKLISCNTLQPA